MDILELVPGSLTSEVQRVSLESEAASSNGTFRIEVSDGLADGDERDRVDADHDGRYWTCELTANSTSAEVCPYLKMYQSTNQQKVGNISKYLLSCLSTLLQQTPRHSRVHVRFHIR